MHTHVRMPWVGALRMIMVEVEKLHTFECRASKISKAQSKVC